MIRVFLDTNILVSALLNPTGSPGRLFLMTLLEPDIHPCLSADVFAEYEEVIRRPRLRRSEVQIAEALQAIRERCVWVEPVDKVRACSDADDDIFLECAVAGDAQYLITGNIKDFPANWGRIQVVTARTFLDIVG